MSKIKFYYSDGSELQKKDIVLVNNQQIAHIENVLIPGSEDAINYSCEEGGVIIVFENGDVQVWSDTDEDICLIRRN